MNKDLEYYRKNAEEDYKTTPISVLRYISELEQSRQAAVSGSVCPCDKLPDGEIAISSKALTDPNWTDGQTDR